MQTDIRSIVEAIDGTFTAPELIHETVDMAFTGTDPNELTDDYSNILLVTNLVHTRLMQVAAEVDIVAILFTNNHIPAPKIVARAQELEIDLIQTSLSLEEVGRRLKSEFGSTLEVRDHIPPQGTAST